MDARGIRSKIWYGFGKAAAKLGFPARVYRAATAHNPVVEANHITTLPASFNAEDMGYRKPNKYGHPTWFALLDGNHTQVGDILVSEEDGTFFIAAQQTDLPILVVSCNTTADVLRVPVNANVGLQPYGGVTAAAEQALMTAWPASILLGGKGEHNDANLPADTRAGQYSILLPAVAGTQLRASDIVRDHMGRRFALMSVELTDLGWRLTAREELA